jgi:hypothetical protein
MDENPSGDRLNLKYTPESSSPVPTYDLISTKLSLQLRSHIRRFPDLKLFKSSMDIGK